MSHPTKSTTHNEKFFHLVVEDHDKVYAATVFAREDVPGSNLWGFAVAFCSHSDQFCRRTGRQVARRRYFQSRASIQPKLIVGSADIQQAVVDFATEQCNEI